MAQRKQVGSTKDKVRGKEIIFLWQPNSVITSQCNFRVLMK